MGYRDGMIPGYEEMLRRIEEKRASCYHTYKEIMRVDSELGMVVVYTCTKCSDRQCVKLGEESSLVGEIVTG